MSKHLKVLEHAGLITRGRTGQLRAVAAARRAAQGRRRNGSSPTGAKEGDEAVTVVLTDLGGGRTQMAFHQGGGGLTPEGYEGAKAGWNTFFDIMAEQVARH